MGGLGVIMRAFRVLFTAALCLCIMDLTIPALDSAWAKDSKNSKAEKDISKGSQESKQKGGKKKSSQPAVDLEVVRIWLDSKCRLNFQIKNAGKGKLSSSEHKRLGVRVSRGKKSAGFALSKVDPKGALAKPGGKASFNSGLLIKGSSKVKVAVSQAPRETQTKDNQKSQILVSRCVVKAKKQPTADTAKKTSSKTLGAASSTMKAKSGAAAAGVAKTSKKPQASLTIAGLKLKDNRIQVIIRNQGKGKLNPQTAMQGRLLLKSASHNRTWSLLQLDPTRSKLGRSKKELVFDTKLVLKKSELVKAQLVKVPGKGLTKQKRLTPTGVKSVKLQTGGGATTAMGTTAVSNIKKRASTQNASTVRALAVDPKVKHYKKPKEREVRGQARKPVHIDPQAYGSGPIRFGTPPVDAVYHPGDSVTLRYVIEGEVDQPGEISIRIQNEETLEKLVEILDYYTPLFDGGATSKETHFRIPPDAPSGTYKGYLHLAGYTQQTREFEIGLPVMDLDMPTHHRDIIINWPNSGVFNICEGGSLDVEWQLIGELLPDPYVTFTLKAGEMVVQRWNEIAGTHIGDNRYRADLPLDPHVQVGDQYRLHAELRFGYRPDRRDDWETLPSPTDHSDSTFTISRGIMVTSPYSASNYATRQADIRFRSACELDRVNLILMRGNTEIYTIRSNVAVTAAVGSDQSFTEYRFGANQRSGTGQYYYDSARPETLGENYSIKVVNVDDWRMYGLSQRFSVAVPRVNFTSTDLGTGGTLNRVRIRLNWGSSGINPDLPVELYADVRELVTSPADGCHGEQRDFLVALDQRVPGELTWIPRRSDTECLPWQVYFTMRVPGWESMVSGETYGLRVE